MIAKNNIFNIRYTTQTKWTGQIGQNKGFPERPILKLITDRQGNEITDNITIDLLEHNSMFIKPYIG